MAFGFGQKPAQLLKRVHAVGVGTQLHYQKPGDGVASTQLHNQQWSHPAHPDHALSMHQH